MSAGVGKGAAKVSAGSAAVTHANTSGATPPWLLDFFLLGAIWGSSFLFMRISTVEFGPLPSAAVRVSIAAAFLLPILIYKGLTAELRKHWKRVFFVGLLNSGIPFACFSFALLSITTGLSSLINATVPLFGALVAWLWLRDRPSGSRSLGLVIGFAGVAMLAWGKASFKPDASGLSTGWAVMACFVAVICYALSASYTRRYLGGISPLVTATGSQVGAMLGLLLPALWLWPAQWPSANAWLAQLAVGVMCTGLAYILFFRLIAHAGPARALSVTYLVPVFAVTYGLIFLGESVTSWMLICAAVILVGTLLSTGLVQLGRFGRRS